MTPIIELNKKTQNQYINQDNFQMFIDRLRDEFGLNPKKIEYNLSFEDPKIEIAHALKIALDEIYRELFQRNGNGIINIKIHKM